ncbi:hypothetical protein [Nocardia puris]|uniref:Glycosyl transferase family 2 n=2 Tax=Nocardia puris TaxID=208602 RepID=A0A366D5E7_9NOCA|nr:hypothetical protein [Nocardia puris]RBO85252.1 hypothetical protein DFR74_115100 [Nocardia puris]
MTLRVLIGLPSFNGADTIGKVVSDIDAALRTLPFPVEATHLNADSSSVDGTTGAFLSTPTHYPKKVIKTGYWSGQGANGKAILEAAHSEGVDATLIVDTDLAAVDYTWVHALIGGVHTGRDFVYPLRPPTWNGGDLTYQLTYPLLAGASGVDLREPLCGDLALSASAVRAVLEADWTADDLRFGFHVLVASTAVANNWTAARLEVRRRNPLRSFGPRPAGEFRMGGKFAETSTSVRHHIRRIAREVVLDRWTPSPAETPIDSTFIVPARDPDIKRLARTTAHQLREDVRNAQLDCFPAPLRDQLVEHALGEAELGMNWELWRECLFVWLTADDDKQIPVDTLETLFLNRAVGHHTEIADRPDWYSTVLAQARDVFAHRDRFTGAP